jgi:hypothetical protein
MRVEKVGGHDRYDDGGDESAVDHPGVLPNAASATALADENTGITHAIVAVPALNHRPDRPLEAASTTPIRPKRPTFDYWDA